MPTIGGLEMLIIAVVAIVVVGPRDLPKMLRDFGQALGRLRGLSREFTDSIQDMATDIELEDMRRSIETVRNPVNAIKRDLEETLDPTSGHARSKTPAQITGGPETGVEQALDAPKQTPMADVPAAAPSHGSAGTPQAAAPTTDAGASESPKSAVKESAPSQGGPSQGAPSQGAMAEGITTGSAMAETDMKAKTNEEPSRVGAP